MGAPTNHLQMAHEAHAESLAMLAPTALAEAQFDPASAPPNPGVDPAFANLDRRVRAATFNGKGDNLARRGGGGR